MNFRLALSCVVAASVMTSSFGDSERCKSITEIACSSDEFEILCWTLRKTGLNDTLADPGSNTVFAPTDDAFLSMFGGKVVSCCEW
jgi:uncharacterized surface protein with fasciclin (FAS1) repeats